MIHIKMILAQDTTKLCALIGNAKHLKTTFSVILFTARLRKQFVSCGILMAYHVTVQDLYWY